MTIRTPHAPERQRLENQRSGAENWRRWGPYLSERAWGTVREDYSADGNAWNYLSHDDARSRAYRWSEDGLGGLSDDQQRLCFALALWNGADAILKERAFGLTGNQGNRGEDVKEYYFYQDATPSHSFLRYLYKYPQRRFPYERLIEENARRSRHEPPFNLSEASLFDDGRYFDVEVCCAKAGPDEIHIRITAANRGPEPATLHLLPTLWFRNTWSWGDGTAKPVIRVVVPPKGAAWAIEAAHEELGQAFLYGAQEGTPLFTENETNGRRLWGDAHASPYAKDSFHRRIINGETGAVRTDGTGTKFASWHALTVPPGSSTHLDLVLSERPLSQPFVRSESVFVARREEADAFYAEVLPEANAEDRSIVRQALAGMIFSKQFFHFDVSRWLDGDAFPAPAERQCGRNARWKHMKAADILSMPDAWEYPWFAAWDLAFHTAALALVDVDFAKDQIEIMVNERYLHPNGQIPAYEWNFSDVNPPVHALGALKVFRAERVQRGLGDHAFLGRVFHKLLLNFAWWINQKDGDGSNVFEGGFLGLDNISVFDRSQPLPGGYRLKQADATGWMAMFALNMTLIALELTADDPAYEDIAIQTYEQFLSIANTLAGYADGGVPIWDEGSGFFKDLIIGPNGTSRHIDVYSMVGLIPLYATEIVDQRLLAHAPRFRERLRRHAGGVFRGNIICACPETVNARGEHLLSVVDHTMLEPLLGRLLDEAQFLSPFGVRSVSKIHEHHRELGELPGVGWAMIEYVPGESNSPLFGGNSNWRGPIWMPVNFLLVQSLEKFYRYLGDNFTVAVPSLGGATLNLQEIAHLIAERLVNIYRRDQNGTVAAMQGQPQFTNDAHWRDLLLFYEYFHAETGQGLGAAHQTGWTGLIANLVMRRYRRGIPRYWREQQAHAAAAAE